jgi:hypothetical protein
MADETTLADWTKKVERSVAELAQKDLAGLIDALVQASRDVVATSEGNKPGNWEPHFVWAMHRAIAAAALVGATCEWINGTKWQ